MATKAPMVRGVPRISTIGIKVQNNHTAEIIDGCYSAGKYGYARIRRRWPSHSNSHVVQYANGKRTIIFIVNGRYSP